MAKESKRPHTLKKRIRSFLWNFLMEDPPTIQADYRDMAKLIRQAAASTNCDNGEAQKYTSK